MNRVRLNSLLMFVWLIVGYAMIHATVAGWLVGAVVSLFWQSSQTYEQLHASTDGEISIQESGTRVTFRKLDGTPITDTSGLNASTVYSSTIAQPQNKPPLLWQYRIASFTDFQREKTAWYLVIPPEETNRCYFVGFDQYSRRPLGYIGLEGFSHSVPTREQSFAIRTDKYDAFGGNLVLTQNGTAHGAFQVGEWLELNYVQKVNSQADTVWILSRGNVYEIRLGARTVQTRFENRSDFQSLSSAISTRDGKKYFHLLVRTDSKLLSIDPETYEFKETNVGPIDPDIGEMIYAFESGQLLFCQHHWKQEESESVDQRKLTWIDGSGQIEKVMDLELNKRRIEADSTLVTAVVACPMPILPIGITVISPFFELRAGLPPTYYGRFRYIVRITWFWMLSSTAIGIVACWACRQRERLVFGSSNWFWPVLMLPLGFYGWMAYAFLKPLPPRMPNRQWRPATPEPVRPLGTEIYA